MTQAVEDVEALRARLHELERQLAVQTANAQVPPERSRRDRQWWRSIVFVVLVTVGAVLAPLAVVATWANDEVGDTDRFMETVEPLASDPAVQSALAARITEEINQYIDAEEVTEEALTALSGQDFVPPRAAVVLPSLAVPLSSAIESFIRTRVDQVIQSDTFEQAWVEAMRLSHEQMVAVLTGDTPDAIEIADGAVTIDIGTFVASVKEILIADGFSFATRIPQVSATFTVFQADNIGTGQKIFGWLETTALILPILALLLLFAAVMVARNRRKGLLTVGLAIAGSMALLGLVLNLVRPLYLDAIGPDVLAGDAAAAIYDQVVSFIRTSLRAVGIVFLAVALAAFWFAPTGSGAALRSGAGNGLSRLRNRTGMDTGPVGRFLVTYRTFTRVAVVGAGTLIYLGLDHPTGRDAGVIVVLVVLALVVLEFLSGSTVQEDDAAEEEPVPV